MAAHLAKLNSLHINPLQLVSGSGYSIHVPSPPSYPKHLNFSEGVIYNGLVQKNLSKRTPPPPPSTLSPNKLTLLRATVAFALRELPNVSPSSSKSNTSQLSFVSKSSAKCNASPLILIPQVIKALKSLPSAKLPATTVRLSMSTTPIKDLGSQASNMPLKTSEFSTSPKLLDLEPLPPNPNLIESKIWRVCEFAKRYKEIKDAGYEYKMTFTEICRFIEERGELGKKINEAELAARAIKSLPW